VKSFALIVHLLREVVRTYCPSTSTSGLKTCPHTKAVRASFSVPWKNARAKAPRVGESLVKPAAVKIARIMCSDAVANKLVMVFLQTTPSSGASKNSQSIFSNKLLLLRRRNEVKSSEMGETRDYRFWKPCTVHGVRATQFDWGLRGTISLLLSACQTYHMKIHV